MTLVIAVTCILLLRRRDVAAFPAEPAAERREQAHGTSAVSDDAARNELPGADSRNGARTVLTVTEAGIPIRDAEVYARSALGWLRAGTSDAKGATVLPDGLRVTHVVGRASGFATTRVVLAQPTWNDPLVVVLASGWTHCGSVALTSSGAQPPAGVSVVALERDAALALEARDRWLDHDPSLAKVEVDAAGGFCLTGLRRDSSYSLLAGGAGFVMTRPVVSVIDERSPPRHLEVGRLFGTLVLLVDEHGSPVPPTGKRNWEAWCPGASSAWEGLHAHLAGLDPALPPEHGELLLFSSDATGDTIGPVGLDHEVAGYERGQATMEARAVGLGVAQHLVTLTTVASERGDVAIRFVRADGAASEDGDRELVRNGWLELLEADSPAGARALRFGLHVDDTKGITARGVPSGAYLARYLSPVCSLPARSRSGLRIEVTQGGAELELSLDSYGALMLDLRTPDGGEYAGVAQFALLSGPPQQPGANGYVKAMVSGTGGIAPPYRIEGLVPGEYTIALSTPTFLGEGGEPLHIVVRAGEEAVLTAWRRN